MRDTLLTRKKKAWAPQCFNDMHVQKTQMSVYKITYLYWIYDENNLLLKLSDGLSDLFSLYSLYMHS